jgi:hypothetical protein
LLKSKELKLVGEHKYEIITGDDALGVNKKITSIRVGKKCRRSQWYSLLLAIYFYIP